MTTTTTTVLCTSCDDEPAVFRFQIDANTRAIAENEADYQYACRACVAALFDDWLGEDGELDAYSNVIVERLTEVVTAS